MKRLLLLASLGLSLILGASTVQAALSAQRQPAPVVATWFSNLRPVSGQRETLYVQFSRGKQPLAGGRLSATIRYVRHALRLRGTTTNRQGKAWTRFTVPHGLKGQLLLATTTIVFQGQRYLGSNHVRVVG
jgi:hypothetical protein